MANPSDPAPLAGGFPIAASILIGCGVGIVLQQPTIGFLAGLAVGAAIAVYLWRRRR